MTASNKYKKSFEKITKLCNRIADWLTLRSPSSVVWFSFSLILLYTVVAMILDQVTFVDSSEYIALIEDFKNSAYDRAFPKHLPVLYTVFAGLIAKTSLLSPHQSLWLINGVFTALSVFPFYGILKKCVSKTWASWGTLILATFPFFIRNNVAPLIDSARTFFFLFSLYLVFTTWKKFDFGRLAALGISLACLTLGRAEGILLAAVICIVYIVKIFKDTRSGFLNKIIRVCVCTGFPLLLVLIISSPRIKQMYDTTGYPAIDSRQSNAIKSLVEELSPPKKQTPPRKVTYSYENNGGANAVSTDPKEFFLQEKFLQAIIRSLYYPLIPFTLFGLFLWLKRKRYGMYFKLLLLSFVLHNLIFFVLRAAIPRYLLINTAIMMPFTLIGCRGIWLYVKRHYSAYIGVLSCSAMIFIAGSGIYSLHYFFEYKYEYVKEVGTDLKKCNTEVDRPVVLTLGGDRGIGYYSDVNVVRYEKFALNEERSLDDVILNGVDSKYVFFWHGREIPETLYIDALIIDNKKHADAVKGYEQMFHAPRVYGRLTVYEVKR